MERIQGSIERERVAHREYSAMDKVMNEGMYLAEKKKVESREEFTHRRGKIKRMMTAKSMSDSKRAGESESLSDSTGESK